MPSKAAKKGLYVSCPSYAVQGPLERTRFLRSARRLARRCGWTVAASPLLGRYLGAGAWLPAGERAEDIVRALAYEMVWACRGGYGCIDLARPLLDADCGGRPRLIGYSDVTVLHACWKVRGWGESYYGNLSDALPGTRSAATLLPLLDGCSLRVDVKAEAAVRVLCPGVASGPCFAACLTVLAGLCGTPAMPDLEGHVLFIEDIDEHAYQVDFAMNQLHLSGALAGVAALAGGTFIAPHAPDYNGPSALDILRNWGERLGIPVLARLPFGHRTDAMFLPVGRATDLSANADGSWSLGFRVRR